MKQGILYLPTSSFAICLALPYHRWHCKVPIAAVVPSKVNCCLKNPEKFVAGINNLLQQQKLVTAEIMELADGRVFEKRLYSHFCRRKTIRDISGVTGIYPKEKKQKADLKSSQELWQFALEGAGDGVWEYDFETEDVFFSKQYKKMLGYDDDEFKNDANEWLSRCIQKMLLLLNKQIKSITKIRSLLINGNTG